MATEPNHKLNSSSPSWISLARTATTAPIGLILFAEDSNVLSVNQQALALINADPNTVLNRPLTALLEDDDKALHDGVVQCTRRGQRLDQRMILRTPAGNSIDCDVVIERIDDGGGEPYHALWLNDVSEHVAMQRSLLQAERLSALGEIVAGVAHELNNPLTGILGYSQLLLDDSSDPKSRQRLEHVVNEAKRCEAVVQSLRGFSSHAATEKAFHNLNQVLDTMVTLLEYQMRVDGIEIARHYSEDMPPAFVDPHALGRAFLNIVHNSHQALDLTKNQPREFTVSTEADQHEIRIRFRDNGPGIKAEHLTRVFDPFFSTREFGRGIGLGLSVAYGAVRDHGGRIDVTSTPGHGAEFTVVLPRADVPQ